MGASRDVKIPPPLSAQDKSSFAYKTMKERLPVILVKTIDFFHRQRKELHKFGGTLSVPSDPELVEIETDAKEIIAQLAKIRKELETNKPAQLIEKLTLNLELEYFNDDVEAWNKTLEASKLDDGALPRWFDSPWLLVECYLYRKIKEAVLKTKRLQMFDPFVEQKQSACRSSLSQMTIVANHFRGVQKSIKEASSHSHPSERSEFSLFVQLALWANKSDLSISGMSTENMQSQKLVTDVRESLYALHKNILCDNMSELWFKVQSIKERALERGEGKPSSEKPLYIDLVADNAGYEIFVDLCLIHFLSLMLCCKSSSESKEDVAPIRFRIHLKRMPWFVSDALRHDIDWLINFMTSPDQEESLQALGAEWKSFLDSKLWEIHDHKFWTLPHDYSEMKQVANDLYSEFSNSSLVIFKGDLNYRKLTGDRKWHILTPFRVALRDFMPAPLVALRTAKADVVVGIEDVSIFSRINNNELPRDWMVSGDFGLIQFAEPL